MYDLIIVVFVAIWIFFMIRRGGCCGMHRNTSHRVSENKSCCGGNHSQVNQEQNNSNDRKEL